jgi:hypothetical protein
VLSGPPPEETRAMTQALVRRCAVLQAFRRGLDDATARDEIRLMAIVSTSALVSGISGSVGGLTFRRTSGGQVVQSKGSIPSSGTLTAEVGRNRFAALSARWAALEETRRNAWELLGEKSKCSGFAAFCVAARWQDDYQDNTGLPVVRSSSSEQSLAPFSVEQAGQMWMADFDRLDVLRWSVDCQHWRTVNTGYSSVWSAISFSPDRWRMAVVGYSGVRRAAYSDDNGETWTWAHTPDGTLLYSVARSESTDRFVAVGAGSPYNGCWSHAGDSYGGIVTASVAGSYVVLWFEKAGLFITGGYVGAARIATSSDGINWTNSPAFTSASWFGGAVSEEQGRVLLVGNHSTSPCVWSDDGLNWTSSDLPNTGTWRGVTWCGKLKVWYATSYSGAPYWASSPDGKHWVIHSRTDSLSLMGCAWSEQAACVCSAVNMGNALSVLSPIDLKPTDDEGMPFTLDRYVGPQATSEVLRSLKLPFPNPEPWTWTVAGTAGARTIVISVPAETGGGRYGDYTASASGASQTWLRVEVGLPMEGSRRNYRWKYRPAGMIFISSGPWECEPLSWPWEVDLLPGMRIPVRLRYFSRGERVSPVRNAWITTN